MRLGTFYGVGYINEGPPLEGVLKVTQQRIDISTSGPKPDPDWTFVDSASHFHARAGDEYPTLIKKAERRDCDGSCGGVCEGEGYGVTVYSCMLCRERIEPGMIPGPHYDTMPGLCDWEVQLGGGLGSGLSGVGPATLMLRFEAIRPEPWLFFGPAVLADMTVSGGLGDEPRVSVVLYAAGQLGDRPALARAEKAA